MAGGIILWLSFGLLLGMAMAWLIRIIFGAEIVKWIDRVLLIITPFTPVGVAYWLYYSSGNSYGLGMGLGVIVTAFFILSLIGFYITWLAGFTINRVIFGIKQKKELIVDDPTNNKIKFLNWWERR